MNKISPELVEIITYLLSSALGWFLKWLNGRKAEAIGNQVLKEIKSKKDANS